MGKVLGYKVNDDFYNFISNVSNGNKSDLLKKAVDEYLINHGLNQKSKVNRTETMVNHDIIEDEYRIASEGVDRLLDRFSWFFEDSNDK